VSWRRPQPEHGPVPLTRRRIYILPTRHGLVFGVVLLAMLIGAINYQNGLAYLLTFLLSSLGIVSILHSYRNLHGLVVHFGQPAAVFAGERASFPLQLENPLGRARYALRLEREGEISCTDLPASDAHWLHLPMPTKGRGLQAAGRLVLSSIYPLGLFRAWSYLYPAQPVLVYPHPEGPRELPPAQHQAEGGEGSAGRGGDDFDSLRPYHEGDSLKHVHWKALARGQGMVTKQFAGGGNRVLWLHWEQTSRQDTEQRLSALCRWVLEADSRGIAYGLVLPHQQINPASGPAQRKRCLEALALYGVRN
jgi:uncharacterized protein (DUF58 family)